MPPPRGAARSRRSGGESLAEVQRKTLRPLGANTLTQFEHPGQPVQEKEPPRQGRTRLRQFEHPGQPVQEKEPPRQGEPADAVRAPRSAGAGKGAAPSGRTRLRSSRPPLSRCRKRSRPLGANTPAAVRVPRSAGAGKCRVQPAIKIFKKICVTLLQNTRK